MPLSPPLKLTYFDLDGRASVIRKALSLGGVPFTDERVPRDLTPLKSKLPYGKVPVLDVDGAIFAETMAIARYIGRITGQFPPASEPLAAAMIDEIIDSFDDLFERIMAPSFWETDPEKKKHMREQLLQGPLPQGFALIDKRLAQIAQHPFFQRAPSKIYLHDVFAWDYVSFMRSGHVDHIPTTFIDAYKTMVAMHDKVEKATPSGPTQNDEKPCEKEVVPMPLPSKLKLTYFDMPGRAELIRLAFHIGGVEFEDERLSFEEFNRRKSEFPNNQVPVLRVNDSTTLAQSFAIVRYAGTLTGLYPAADLIRALQIDEVLSHIGEFNFALDPSFAETDPVKKKAMREKLVATTIPESLDSLNRRLEQWKAQEKALSSPFAMGGEKLTIADLGIYSLVMFLKSGFMDHVPATIVDKYTHLVQACEAVQLHPRVQDWYAKHPMPAV
jgi:prostaglandin-H2 D-isomerase / glutathione transferase